MDHKQVNVLVEHEDENSIIVWANLEMEKAIQDVPGVYRVFEIYLDPRYDRKATIDDIKRLGG